MQDIHKRQSKALLWQMDGHHESSTKLLPSAKPPTSPSMAHNISYIPPQVDPMASLSTPAARRNPILLMLQDAFVLITSLRYLPGIFLPFKTKNPSDELYLSPFGIGENVLQAGLFVAETIILLLAIPAILMLPGALSIAIGTACFLGVYFLCKPIQGPKVVYSNMNKDTLSQAEQHKDERWLFVNGCMVGHSGLQKNIDRIAQSFGRAVIGVHNTTWGLPFDLVECLIQRAFYYQTEDIRVAHAYIKATLIDRTVSKVVLIGHSQGGIIISLVLDQLFAELPTECMAKLEIYTFGSAASHFSNPLLSLSAGAALNGLYNSLIKAQVDKPSRPTYVISHIEHYANENDMVPRWGVLHCTKDVLNNRYAGSVFVRKDASGHMFNQHYMDPIFPIPEEKEHWLRNNFLDRVIQVDEDLSVKRDEAVDSSLILMRRKSGLEFGDGEIVPESQILPEGGKAGSEPDIGALLTFVRTDSGRLLMEEARGKTVRELSRLWKYQGGRSPPTPSPSSTSHSETLQLERKTGESNKWQGLLPLNSQGGTSGPLQRYGTILTED